MKSTFALPTLGQSIRWTAIFYAGFGLMISVLVWFISMASSNTLLKMLGWAIPGWATGWFFLVASIPLFGLLGAISGVIVYWPMRALVQYFHGSRKTAS